MKDHFYLGAENRRDDKMIKVYIASKYSIGDQAANVRASMDAFNELARLGFAPYSPLLSHFQQIVHPLDYETWMAIDLEWLRQCDVVLRLPGESAGADREVTEAETCNIPAFDTTFDLAMYFNERGLNG